MLSELIHATFGGPGASKAWSTAGAPATVSAPGAQDCSGFSVTSGMAARMAATVAA